MPEISLSIWNQWLDAHVERSSWRIEGLIFVSHCCCNKSPQSEWLNQREFIILQFCRSEVWHGSHWDKIKPCQQGSVLFWRIRGESVFLPFPTSRSQLPSFVHSLLPCLLSQQWRFSPHVKSLTTVWRGSLIFRVHGAHQTVQCYFPMQGYSLKFWVFFFFLIYLSNFYTRHGDQTHHPKSKSCVLHQLSQAPPKLYFNHLCKIPFATR